MPVMSRFERALLVPVDFQAECVRNGLGIGLHSRLLGHVMQFVAHKDIGEI